MINAIFAMDKARGMGTNGTLPWPKDKEDLSWFRKNTINQIVIMGSKTWNDPFMPSPLPNRINVVISSQNKELFENANMVLKHVDMVPGIQDLQEMNADTGIWIIGGPTLLHASKHLISKIYLTEFHDIYNCDVFLEQDFLNDFKVEEELPGTNKTFRILKRIK